MPGGHRSSSLDRRVSHGTAVASLAAGYAPTDESGLDRRIIAVQLPALAARDTSGANIIALAKAASQFIYNRARIMSSENGVAIPVVLNFSFGTGGGPRNGKFILERTIRNHALQYRNKLVEDELEPGASFRVMPAGNAYLSQGHSIGTVQGNKSHYKCDLRLQPGDQTSSFAEFWLAKTAEFADITIKLPGGFVKIFKWDGQPNFEHQKLENCGAVIARLSIDEPNSVLNILSNNELHYRILLAIAPTDVTGLKVARIPAPSGSWSIEINANFQSKSLPIHGWIQRDDAPGGRETTARQAYFEDEAYSIERYDGKGDLRVKDPDEKTSAVRRDGTLSGMATSPSDDASEEAKFLDSIIATSMRWDSDELPQYVAAGNETNIPAPQLAARVDRSRVKPHLLVAGSYSGSKVALAGTSLAALQVARALADYLSALDANERAALTTKDAISALNKSQPKKSTLNSTRLDPNYGIIKHADELINSVERG